MRRMTCAIVLSALATGAVAQDCGASHSAQVGVIEIVQFRVADGVSRDDFVAAAQRTKAALCEIEGFIACTLSEGADGIWTDHVKWTTAEAAQAAMAGSMENDVLLPFLMAIDPDSVTLTYQTPVLLN